MKSLQESLFDQDLIEKGVPIDFETLRNMLFRFGRRHANYFDKNEVIYHEGKMSIFIKKFLEENDSACFELEFGVTDVYLGAERDETAKRFHGIDKVTSFSVPILRFHDRWGSITFASQDLSAWKSSKSDINATIRQLRKKIDVEELGQYHYVTIAATEESVVKVFDLYDKMIQRFCSKDFDKKLKKYVDNFKSKQEIPGLIMDILMKELITKA